MIQDLIPISLKQFTELDPSQINTIVLWTLRQYQTLKIQEIFELISGYDASVPLSENVERIHPEDIKALPLLNSKKKKIHWLKSASNRFKTAILRALDVLRDNNLIKTAPDEYLYDSKALYSEWPLHHAPGGEHPLLQTIPYKMDTTIVLLPTLIQVQNSLGFSLTEFLIGSLGSITVQPIFGKPLPLSGTWADVFVIMPFKEDLKIIYDECIVPVCKKLNLVTKRGDDFFSSEAVINEIWSSIYYSKICIVICTDRNANVFYELGIAHSLGRPCILLAESEADIPFNIRHRRTIIYNPLPDGLTNLKRTLTRALKNEINIDLT